MRPGLCAVTLLPSAQPLRRLLPTQPPTPTEQYAAMSNFEDRGEEFSAEAVVLRRKFSADAGGVGA